MSRRYYSSTARRTTITNLGGINNSATSITVGAATGFPSVPWIAVIDQDTENEEVVLVTATSGGGTTLTVTRGYNGTTAVSHAAGATFNHAVAAIDFDEPNAHVNTDVSHVVVCTSSTRPASPSEGQIIYETDTDLFYGYKGTSWQSIGGGATGGGTDAVFLENGNTVTTNYTITTGKNAVSAGPVTINSGVTVTIPNNSTWVIV